MWHRLHFIRRNSLAPRRTKPLVTEGQLGDFVPGAINRIGSATQILPDTLQIRVWTGFFFATAPVRVDWFQGKLALAQHCFYQTGHGFAEDGCEIPVEEVERTPSDQDMTFVRLFTESNEHTNPRPARSLEATICPPGIHLRGAMTLK